MTTVTIQDVMHHLELPVKFRPLDTDGMVALSMILSLETEKKLDTELKDIIDNDFASRVFSKRIEYLDAKDKIPDIVTLALSVFGFRTPAEAVIAVIDCFNHVAKTGEVLTAKAIYTEIYPDGFYTEDTVTLIIDNVLKPNKCSTADIY